MLSLLRCCDSDIVEGTDSDHIKDDDLPIIKEIFPRAQIVAIPSTGHWVHVEAPQEFARIVIEFLTTDSI